QGFREIMPWFLKAVGTVFALFGAFIAALAIARAVQIPRARLLLTSYANAPADAVPVTTESLRDGQVRLAIDPFEAQSSDEEVQEVMVEADFDLESCGLSGPISATFRYEQVDSGLALD